MDPLEKLKNKYDYRLPKNLVANRPASPRDSARLLVYRRQAADVRWTRFSNLAEHLPKRAVLVFNHTKVIPARLRVIKPTGGQARLLFLSQRGKSLQVLSDRRLQPGAKLKLIKGKSTGPILEVAGKRGSRYTLRFPWTTRKLRYILDKFGVTPLPPYIKNPGLSENRLRKEYQSVFARTGMSVAAPTASLHFTNKLLANLGKAGVRTKFLRLDVGLGTFAPLTEQQINTGKLHSEFYRISPATARFLNKAKASGWPIIAVGTTALRALESAAASRRGLEKLAGQTRLFVREGYRFKFVDGLITNFHVPKSSLLMLVCAMGGREEILELYRQAVKKKFRFFSFGDGMMLLR